MIIAAVLSLSALGGAALAYPPAAEWVGALARSNAVARYAQTTEALTAEQRDALLSRAKTYNEMLTDSPLSDPFRPPEGPSLGSDAAWLTYSQRLSIAGGDGEPMARLRYPAVGVDLPVLHGTDEQVLAHGAGHLYGSSLPVGGAGTHAVITAHNGYTGAEMFDGLDAAEIGERFTVTVAGKTLEYRVDRISVVAPDQLDQLLQVPGRDYITLVTCTPRFINSDRLLVRGERVGTSFEKPDRGDLLSTATVGPPWWVLLALAPVALAVAVLLIQHRASRHRAGVARTVHASGPPPPLPIDEDTRN